MLQAIDPRYLGRSKVPTVAEFAAAERKPYTGLDYTTQPAKRTSPAALRYAEQSQKTHHWKQNDPATKRTRNQTAHGQPARRARWQGEGAPRRSWRASLENNRREDLSWSVSHIMLLHGPTLQQQHTAATYSSIQQQHTAAAVRVMDGLYHRPSLVLSDKIRVRGPPGVHFSKGCIKKRSPYINFCISNHFFQFFSQDVGKRKP